MTQAEMVFFRAAHVVFAVGGLAVALHVDVSQLVSHLLAVVLVEQRQVTEHQVVVLLLHGSLAMLHFVMLGLLVVDIHLRHRINLILNWNRRLVE